MLRVQHAVVGIITIGVVATVPGSGMITAQSDYVARKAECGPDSRPEIGLQGLMTAAERFSAPHANTCNVELVGQEVAEGTSWGGAVVDVCAYLGRNRGQVNGTDGPTLRRPGTAVVDVADPRTPAIVGYLDTPAMIEPNESLAANIPRKLLAAVGPYYTYDDTRTANRSDSDFEIYDVSNCRRPVLKGSLKLSHVRSHGGYFAPDGRHVLVDVLHREHSSERQDARER